MHVVLTDVVTPLNNDLKWESGDLCLCSTLAVIFQSSYFVSQILMNGYCCNSCLFLVERFPWSMSSIQGLSINLQNALHVSSAFDYSGQSRTGKCLSLMDITAIQ